MIDTILHGDVMELRLARPPANAFNQALMLDLTERLRAAPEGGSAAVVISGAPGMFTGGLDVPELLALSRDEVEAFWRTFYGLLLAAADSEVPVGVAITGHCPAAGAVLSAFCDYRVMARGSFKIGMNEVQVGLVVPPLIQYAMKRLTGDRRGEALLIAGALISPEEALDVGLVDGVAEPEDVVTETVAWAQGLAALPRQAMLDTRRISRSDLVDRFDELSDSEYAAMTERWFSEETQATMRALVARLAKR